MEYKKGDLVIIIDDYNLKCVDKYRKGKDLKNKIGKIIYTDNNNSFGDYYNVEILDCPYRKECIWFNFNNRKYCHPWVGKEIKSINSLKLKKLIKHGV